MATDDGLRDSLREGYSFSSDGDPEPPSVLLGRPLTPTLDAVLTDVPVRVPLRMLNRHGLIAGATGTGKTKTLQLIAEQLSEQGVPVFLADLKGDLTGLAEPAVPEHVEGFLAERMETMGFAVGEPTHERSDAETPDSAAEPPLWRPRAFPVDVLSLTGEQGVQLRVPVREFGPLLLAKVMDCSDVQQSVLQVIFRFADDTGRPLATLDDLGSILRHLTSDEGAAAQDHYGGMSTQTLNVLRRKLVELEGQGADLLFGEPGYDVTDLWAPRDGDPFGVVSVLRLVDVQTRPRLFSTLMMWLLSAVYANADEVGDADKPRLVFFFDEAHLLFDGASDALLELVELTVRMIRSKGIGVFFVTQQPTDIPDDVLAQLGTRVQHALRAFTPNDQAALKQTAATYPVTDHYDVRETLTSLGIGEGLVVGLGRTGAPTPTVATRLVGPRSSMDPVPHDRLAELVTATAERGGAAPAVAGHPAAADPVAADVAATGSSPRPSPDSAEDLTGAAAPTPSLAAASTQVTAGERDLVRVLAHRCSLTRPERPISRHARVVRTLMDGSSPMRRDLTKDVVAVEGGLGELSLTADELRFTGDAEFTIARSDVDEIQFLHGLIVVGSEAFLLDPDDELDLLAAWDPAWADEDLTVLALPPDDLLDELAALDDETVAAAVPSAPPPSDTTEPAGERDAVDGPSIGTRVADVASSTGVEEVAASVGKMLGVNKGATRSLFRAWRKSRR